MILNPAVRYKKRNGLFEMEQFEIFYEGVDYPAISINTFGQFFDPSVLNLIIQSEARRP